ncbi:MAG: hypothetical protein RL441_138, partial [Actinomycetota bacterium]
MVIRELSRRDAEDVLPRVVGKVRTLDVAACAGVLAGATENRAGGHDTDRQGWLADFVDSLTANDDLIGVVT